MQAMIQLKQMIRAACLGILLLVNTQPAFTQETPSEDNQQQNTEIPDVADIDMEEITAREEFRWGVKAFHNGLFNKSILSLERSLTFKPENFRTRRWLGRVYYRSGFEQEAIKEWERILDAGGGGVLLENTVRILNARRGLADELSSEDSRFVIAQQVEGVREETQIFNRPGAVSPRSDGSYYLPAYGSNEILVVSANGAVINRLNGGLYSFDHPFDICRMEDGSLFVTEFEGDRISRVTDKGRRINAFGESGRDEGQLLGPQYITKDNEGYLYVTDWGNRRVSKYDYEGNFILSFGNQSGEARILKPAGIVFHQDRLYVADKQEGSIKVYDKSGNYLRTLVKNSLEDPEDISVYDSDTLIVADTDDVKFINLSEEVIQTVSNLEGNASQVISAVRDANGNIVSVDFGNNSLYVLSPLYTMYSGLFIEIMRMDSTNFPEVTADISIETREGNPVVGLSGQNILVTEGATSIENPTLTYTGYNDNRMDISLLVEHSDKMSEQKDQIRQVIAEVYRLFSNTGSMRVVSAGQNPVTEIETPASEAAVVNAAADKGAYTSNWRFDLGLRHAASDLIPGKSKRAVIYVTNGTIPEKGFTDYGLVELMQYMKNNNILFYPIYISKNTNTEELNYLAKETGGKPFYVYQPSGIKGLKKDIADTKNGIYTITYTSNSNPEFGRAYIPVQVEVTYMRRSGRDEAGYFAPLEF